jgi:hypothetical protein
VAGRKSQTTGAEMIPKITAYHPEIHVEKDGERYILKLSVPDYTSDGEILKKLAQKEDVQTVGEVVDSIQKNRLHYQWPHRMWR